MSVEAQLQELIDRQAITNVLYAYCSLVDSFQLDRLVNEVYAEDGSDDHGGGPVVGRAALRAWFEDSTANVVAIAHNLCNIMIEVDGDHATARSSVISWTWTRPNAAAGPLRNADYALSLMYVDELTRYPEGWRIDCRVLIPNASPTGQTSVVALGSLPETQKGIHALARRAVRAT